MCLKSYVIDNEKQLVSVLDKMYENSKKKTEFYDLVEVMKNEQTIITAIHNIKSNKGSFTAGIDKVNIDKYLQMDTTKLINLIRKCIDNYKPNAVRRVYIPKKSGKLRALGIPTMIDRIIQEITRIVIEPIVEAKFFNHSYGFRPYRNTEHAIARIVSLVNTTKCYVAIEGDIKSFFDNVNHNILIKMMWGLGIRDKRVLNMIKKMLKAGIMEDLKYNKSEIGTPQGGIISPLLANIYLNAFDKYVATQYEEHLFLDDYINKAKSSVRKVALDNARKKLKKEHVQKYLIRYADDWIILTESKSEANKLLYQCKKFFKHRLSLELSDDKTMITDLREENAKFLGFELFVEKKRLTNNLVCKVMPNREMVKTKTREILDKVEAIRYQETPLKTVVLVEKINSMIIGIANYYKISIAKSILQNIDNKIYYTAYKTVRRLYGSGKDRLIDIDKVNNLTNRHMGYKQKTFFFDYKELKIGLTKASITPIIYARKFNPIMTPYTEEGRELKSNTSKKQRGKLRPTLYNPYELFTIVGNQERKGNIYNFEYVMNREYAYNRDKGMCMSCKQSVYTGIVKCHHKRRKLPLNQINKVPNLITLCDECHELVHSNTETKNKKILELRNIIFEEDNLIKIGETLN